jgi:TolB-like protein
MIFMRIMSRFISLFLILSLLSCNSMPQTAKAPQAQAPQATPQSSQAEPFYWTGDGGKGKSIAILSPKVSGLAESQSYLPDLVQGEFVSNFSSFSAISVLDRANLDEQYSELLSGYYDDNSAAGMDLGHLTPTDYIMGGTITKTSTGYALQIRVTKTADKMTTALYSGTCTFDELDNLTGIRKASLDLLQKLGVENTASARTELAIAASSNHVEAQTALARGISAQRQGTEVEALSYYFQAAALDASLLEATSRSSVMFANITSGNIGENTRNDIEWRRQWVARLTETEQYFNDLLNANAMPYTLLYSTEIIPCEVNYQTETQTLSINTNLHATGGIWLSSMERALQAVYDGLDATNRKQVWGLQNWPSTSVTNLKPFETKSKSFSISAELVNSNGKVIGRTTFQAGGWWNFSTGPYPIW